MDWWVLSTGYRYLSGFGGGLYKRHAVAPRQLLRLLRLHCAGAEVALVPHEHHGDAVTVLHPTDLLSEENTRDRARCKRWSISSDWRYYSAGQTEDLWSF